MISNFLDKQKEFKEQAGFCKVSFMQYDEEVCDILDYAKMYWIDDSNPKLFILY